MKTRYVLAFSGLVLSVVLLTGAAVSAEGDPEQLETMARQFVSTWSRGEYAAATGTFDETMEQMMPPEKLQEAWESLIARAGAFKGLTGARMEKWQGYDIVFVTCEFEFSPVDIKVVYDGERRIAGVWFVPTEQSAAPYEPPPYVDRAAFKEEEIRVGSGEWTLPGTLSLPTGAGPFPAVVLVHGSGPNDRDETVGPNKPFRDLAWGLATGGIAVLRYDKRTKVYGAKIVGLEGGFTIREETVDDAVAAAELLRGDPRIDAERIFVLGHSLGGYCVPLIGQSDPRITGFIVMAGATRPLEDLLIEQYTYIFSLDGEISDGERIEIEKIEALVAAVKDPNLSPDTPREALPFNSNALYWLDLRDYSPTGTAAQLEQPLLILHGERDYQVTMVDFDNWKTALSSHADVEFKSYPSLNHLFISGEGPCTPEEYQMTGHVAEMVVADIARWIGRH